MKLIDLFITFISLHYVDIIAFALLLVALVFTWKKSPKGKFIIITKLRELVRQAEQYHDSLDGQQRFDKVYNWLPFIVKLIYTKKEIDKIVDFCLDELDKALEKEQLNKPDDNIANEEQISQNKEDIERIAKKMDDLWIDDEQ